MRSKKLILAFIAIAMCFATSCRKAYIQNINNEPIPYVSPEKKLSQEQIEKAIVVGGSRLGWSIVKAKPNLMVGTLNIRKHQVQVDITYTDESYSINYRDSTNMKSDGTKIHRNYNAWVKKLDDAIRKSLADGI